MTSTLRNIVIPWFVNTFDLSDNFSSDTLFKTLRSLAMWATEKAKIELSSNDQAIIALDDSELRTKDGFRQGHLSWIYRSIRAVLDELISSKIEESIAATRETLDKAGLSPHEIERVVFVGGPTQYKPLRDKVTFELGIDPSTEVNPMTAVVEGAAVFAESIDWSSQNRGRKSGRGTLSASGGLDIVVQLSGPYSRHEGKSC